MSVRIFRFGIDYLRYNLCADFSPNHFGYLFHGFSESSKQKFDVEFLGHTFTSVNYLETKQLLSLSFMHGRYHVLTIVKYLDMGIVQNVPYAVTFEGTFFALPDLLSLLSVFTSRFRRSLSVSRIDLCLDCNVKTEVLWKWKSTQFKHKRIISESDHIETFYLGKKVGNKKYFIRVYDKKIDSMRKGKFVLFHHYLSEDVVTRIEAEVRTLTVKVLEITPDAVLQYVNAAIEGDENGVKMIEQWFSSLCMNERGTIFYSLRGLALSRCEKLVTARFTGRSKEIEKLRYVRTFLTMARRLYEEGFDVFGFLKEELGAPLSGDGSNSSNYPVAPSSVTLTPS